MSDYLRGRRSAAPACHAEVQFRFPDREKYLCGLSLGVICDYVCVDGTREAVFKKKASFEYFMTNRSRSMRPR